MMPAQLNPLPSRKVFAKQVADRETAHLRESRDEAHEQYLTAQKLFDTVHRLTYLRIYDSLN